MKLTQLLALSDDKQFKKLGISQQRLSKDIDGLRNLIAYFRQYPDVFVDFIKGKDSTFKFYAYQRIFLRCVMRHRYVYCTFPRAFCCANKFIKFWTNPFNCLNPKIK